MRVTMTAVGHCFPDRPWLFRGLSATLEPGEIHALVGPSGSGKSTLLSLLAGWLQPLEGSMDAQGITAVSWVFQGAHGMARRTVLDHVSHPFLCRGHRRHEADQRASALLQTFGLGHLVGRAFFELSGGEAQRLMFARAIAAEPDLLLIDEPTAQLDRSTASRVNEVVSALASPRRIVVVATHDPRTQAACTRTIDLAQHRGGDEESG